MAVASHCCAARSHRSFPRQSLRAREPVRHPRKTCHHNAERHSVGKEVTGRIWKPCLSAQRRLLCECKIHIYLAGPCWSGRHFAIKVSGRTISVLRVVCCTRGTFYLKGERPDAQAIILVVSLSLEWLATRDSGASRGTGVIRPR